MSLIQINSRNNCLFQEIASLTEARELFLAQKLELQEQVKKTEGELEQVC